jgi:hypothetical protein
MATVESDNETRSYIGLTERHSNLDMEIKQNPSKMKNMRKRLNFRKTSGT